MTNVIPFRRSLKVESYEGGCPVCGKLDRILNIFKTHWCVCHTHKTKWCAGENIYSSWQHETEQYWLENEYLLAGYREVEPVPCNTPELGEAGA